MKRRGLLAALASTLIVGLALILSGVLEPSKEETAPTSESGGAQGAVSLAKTQNGEARVFDANELKTIAKGNDSCFALFIGVDQYDALPNLNYSCSDAKALRDAFLKIGFPKENIWLCVSDGSRRELPTKKNIDAAIEDMLAAAEEAGPKATVFISLSGHGFETQDGEAAFCPNDVVCRFAGGTPTVTKESAVLISELTNKLREHGAEFKMMIVDACRLPAQTKGGADAYQRSFRTVEPSGIAFLQSCRSGEASYEDPEFRQGVFTHYFIEGLGGKAENKDGGVTFLDVCRYASKQTQLRVETAHKGKQTPFFNISGVDFVLKESTRSVADALYRKGRDLGWGIDGAKIDGFRALDLLTQAAEAGVSEAQAMLALLYYDGCEATPPDFKKAVYWASRAGDENPIAQNVLGDCYKDGLGVRQDEAEAKRLHDAAFKRFKELAESGDDPIIFNQLGRCYCNGRGTKINLVEATKYFRLAAERCAISVSNLAEMYLYGLGVERDEAKAIQLYNDALEANCSSACVGLGLCYENGTGVPQDFNKAIEFFRRAAEKNNAQGVARLGAYYANAWSVEKNAKEAIRLYRKAVEWNNPIGTYMLAEALLNGSCGQQDQTKALELFKRAAEQDCWIAFARVAECYENGWGTVKNEKYAKEWSERAFQKWRESAEAGAPYAMSVLGDCYYYGKGVEKDDKKAVEWYRKSSEKGEAAGAFGLGVCYYVGAGVEKDGDEAVKCFRWADERGVWLAKYWLGECYYYGVGVEKDYDEAVRLYRAAAEKNIADAINSLGVCYYNGNGVEQDYVEAARWYRAAAELNHYLGLWNLGNCYYHGNGVEQDYAKAVELYRRAAELGYADAMNSLGLCYWLGEGVDQDYATAIQYFRDAAELDHAAACCSLGNCYYGGDGVKQNDEEAVKWYRKSAELGYASANVKLGRCYREGRGVEKNEEEAARLFRKAAELGDATAMNLLGVCYGDGVGVEKNEDESIRWTRKAADLGVAQAAANLAYLYSEKKDEAESLRWNCRAAELGHGDAAFIAGACYLRGWGDEKDLEKTLKYWRRGAELKNRHSLECLGQAAVWKAIEDAEKKYDVSLVDATILADWTQEFNAAIKERGVTISLEEGIACLEEAEKQEDASARIWLGLCRFYGVGCERDFNEAKRLFRLAALSDASTPENKWYVECAEKALDGWNEKVEKLNAALEAEESERREAPEDANPWEDEDPFAEDEEAEETPLDDEVEARETTQERATDEIEIAK